MIAVSRVSVYALASVSAVSAYDWYAVVIAVSRVSVYAFASASALATEPVTVSAPSRVSKRPPSAVSALALVVASVETIPSAYVFASASAWSAYALASTSAWSAFVVASVAAVAALVTSFASAAAIASSSAWSA